MRPSGDHSPPPKRVKLESNSPSIHELKNEDADAAELNTDGEHCSICLQQQLDTTVIPTCAHEFCFECILVWTEQSRRCPLCSQPVGDFVIHNVRSKYDYQKHYLAPLRTSPLLPPDARANMRRRQRAREWGRRERQEREEADALELAIEKRRWIYQHNLYAKHVASNSFTKYRPHPTPAQFSGSQDLISRTTAFVRRELRVWMNLDVEFLTTFVISLMKAIDIRSESAVKLLTEFLDMDEPYIEGQRHTHAEHFAHEVYSYLRSPYRDLTVYDSVVQYDLPADAPPPARRERGSRWRPASPSHSRSSSPRRSRSPQHRPARTPPSPRSQDNDRFSRVDGRRQNSLPSDTHRSHDDRRDTLRTGIVNGSAPDRKDAAAVRNRPSTHMDLGKRRDRSDKGKSRAEYEDGLIDTRRQSRNPSDDLRDASTHPGGLEDYVRHDGAHVSDNRRHPDSPWGDKSEQHGGGPSRERNSRLDEGAMADVVRAIDDNLPSTLDIVHDSTPNNSRHAPCPAQEGGQQQLQEDAQRPLPRPPSGSRNTARGPVKSNRTRHPLASLRDHLSKASTERGASRLSIDPRASDDSLPTSSLEAQRLSLQSKVPDPEPEMNHTNDSSEPRLSESSSSGAKLTAPEIMARTRARLARQGSPPNDSRHLLSKSSAPPAASDSEATKLLSQTVRPRLASSLIERLEAEKRQLLAQDGEINVKPQAIQTSEEDVGDHAHVMEVKLRMQAQLRVRLAAEKRAAKGGAPDTS